MTLEREAVWSMPVMAKPGRCDWPWCWRRATQLCRAFVTAGDRIISFGRWHCDKHTAKRKRLNLKVLEELSADA